MTHRFELHGKAEILGELPGYQVEAHHYPGGKRSGGRDGMIVRFTPAVGESWIGVFEFGTTGLKALSGIWGLPGGDIGLIVSKGRGVIVSLSNPAEWEEAPIFPIVAVESILETSMTLLIGQTRVAAIDGSHVKWVTPDLSWDGLEDLTPSNTHLTGTAWDPTSRQRIPFSVNLSDGSFTGGSRPRNPKA